MDYGYAVILVIF